MKNFDPPVVVVSLVIIFLLFYFILCSRIVSSFSHLHPCLFKRGCEFLQLVTLSVSLSLIPMPLFFNFILTSIKLYALNLALKWINKLDYEVSFSKNGQNLGGLFCFLLCHVAAVDGQNLGVIFGNLQLIGVFGT